jgi:hypothetical protein
VPRHAADVDAVEVVRGRDSGIGGWRGQRSDQAVRRREAGPKAVHSPMTVTTLAAARAV